jgi:hypothetical protein
MEMAMTAIEPKSTDAQRVVNFFATLPSVQEEIDFEGLKDGKWKCFSCGKRAFPLIKGDDSDIPDGTNHRGWCLECLYDETKQ